MSRIKTLWTRIRGSCERAAPFLHVLSGFHLAAVCYCFIFVTPGRHTLEDLITLNLNPHICSVADAADLQRVRFRTLLETVIKIVIAATELRNVIVRILP